MARKRTTKAEQIRKLLAQGIKPATIARRVKTTTNYIAQVRWTDKRRERQKNRRRPLVKTARARLAA